MDDSVKRVLVVDDHRMFAQSLARLFGLEDDFEVVGIAYSCAEALRIAPDAAPDICVLDYQLPDGDGATLATQLRTLLTDIQILLLTGVNRPSSAQAAMAAGCDAFITKDRAAHELVETMRNLATGTHRITADVADALRERTAALQAYNLTARELEVLQLLGRGLSTTEISDETHISSNTVRTHVQRIINKLGAHSKLEAVAVARGSGLL